MAHPPQAVKVNTTRERLPGNNAPLYEVTRTAIQLCGGLSKKSVTSEKTWEKTSGKLTLRDFLQNNWQVSFKPVKVMENKERLENCHSTATKET